MSKFFYFGFGVINLQEVISVQKRLDSSMSVTGVIVSFKNKDIIVEKCDEETANDILKQLVDTND
jgi:hypothetical protein